MKKSFLIFGIIGAILSTNGYAVQSQDVTVKYTCPDGCELKSSIDSSGLTIAWCKCENGEVDPKITIENIAPSSSEIREIMSQSVLNQAAIKNAKKKKTTSARMTTVSPKVVKKIVYEEIISDDCTE